MNKIYVGNTFSKTHIRIIIVQILFNYSLGVISYEGTV